MSIITYLVICLLCVPLVTKSVGQIVQGKHHSKTLTKRKEQKLADYSNRQRFYDDFLRPLLVVRRVGTEGHTKSRQHIVKHMEDLGWDVEQDRFEDNTPIGRLNFTNIIATRNPKAPYRMVFACHYDSKLYTNFDFIGMTDSAVPCAMLLDLGSTLNADLWEGRSGSSAQISLQFIFFDGEEAFKSWTKTDSIYGARHLAKKWEAEKTVVSRELPPMTQNQRIDIFVLLDLIGYKNPEFVNWFDKTSGSFERLKKIEDRLRKGRLLESEQYDRKYFKGGAMNNFGVEDDHVPFRDLGVPILHLISYPFPPVWHRSDDNNSNFDPKSTDNLLKILRVFIAEYLHLNP